MGRPRSVARYIRLVLASGLLLWLSCAYASTIWCLWMNHLSHEWPQAEGEVTVSEWVTSSRYRIEYDYLVDGKQYAGRRMSYLPRKSGVEGNLAEMRYRVADRVAVYYDPGHASRSVLESSPAGRGYFLSLGVITVVLLVIGRHMYALVRSG